jgi:peptidoglycan-N-acetylmuramic acid deacetylase
MKKTVFFVCVLVIILCLALPAGAVSEAYNWFCVHRKDHLQPKADSSFSFIEKYNAFYIDKNHGDECYEKVIYLTFDAGYENGNVARILDTLKEENVPAAFFILGNLIEKETALVVRMQNEGHLVCNHTFSHKPMVKRSCEEFRAELCKLENCCVEKTGKPLDKYYRPPEGKFDEESLKYACEMGYKTVFWSFAYDDWDNGRQMSSERAKKKILENIHNGEIVLLHPTSSTNAEILRDVIRELKAQGFRFGTLDEL